MNINSSVLPRLALIAGPTASGKSALALALAKAKNGVIINADSAQVYRDLRIVSARPSDDDEAQVPHRLYGYRDGADPCSAADWAADARQAIDQAWQAGQLPILAGGTGLYLRTLLDGIAPVPPIDPDVRATVRALPVDAAFQALAVEDAEAAQRLRPTDTARIARALEVVRCTGRTIREWQHEREGGIAGSVRLMPLILLPPREWLIARCDFRFEEMASAAGVEEVRRLIGRKLPPALPVMRAIGVSQIGAMLDGRLTREEAVEAGRIATRQYAKRQYTWFNHQPPCEWLRSEEPMEGSRIGAALALFDT
jgi:tRNA dimethylallyltransferase